MANMEGSFCLEGDVPMVDPKSVPMDPIAVPMVEEEPATTEVEQEEEEPKDPTEPKAKGVGVQVTGGSGGGGSSGDAVPIGGWFHDGGQFVYCQ